MLREMFRTIKLLFIAFNALRTGIFGAVLVTILALCVAPASSRERDTLGTGVGNDPQLALIAHRAATLMVKADSDALYAAIAQAAPEEIFAWQVRFVAERLADGTMQIGPDGQVLIQSQDTTYPQSEQPNRDFVRSIVPSSPSNGLLAPRANSAKFVTARTN